MSDKVTQTKEPEFIQIGGIRFAVVTDHNLVDDNGVTRLDGHIRYGSSEIRLDDGLGPQARRATIWHEVLHGILTQAGVKKHDEALIEALTYGLMSVLRDNPWLAEPVEEAA